MNEDLTVIAAAGAPDRVVEVPPVGVQLHVERRTRLQQGRQTVVKVFKVPVNG